MAQQVKKPDRIEKEMLLLRNLPSTFKHGKKQTFLGTVIYVRVKSHFAFIVNFQSLTFHFPIALLHTPTYHIMSCHVSLKIEFLFSSWKLMLTQWIQRKNNVLAQPIHQHQNHRATSRPQPTTSTYSSAINSHSNRPSSKQKRPSAILH